MNYTPHPIIYPSPSTCHLHWPRLHLPPKIFFPGYATEPDYDSFLFGIRVSDLGHLSTANRIIIHGVRPFFSDNVQFAAMLDFGVDLGLNCHIRPVRLGLLPGGLVMSPLGDIYSFASWQNRHFGGVFRP